MYFQFGFDITLILHTIYFELVLSVLLIILVFNFKLYY